MNKLIKSIAMGIAGVAMTATAALAADYPERPIGVAVSYGAGGATDFQARIVTMVAGNEDVLGQPMYIVNKPGAGGRVSKKTDKGSGKKDGQLILRLDKDERDAFIKLCKKLDTSASREVRGFIRGFLKKHKD